MAVDHFCLRWNNYKTNMVSELVSLREDEDLVDVSLHCEGRVLKAHKVILSACSSYFRRVFKESPCRHPSVILKDVHHEEVESLLNFIYQGVVYISEKKLNSFLRTAEALEIRGLTGAATEMQDGSFSYLASTQTAPAENTAPPPPPPPPPLLTANLVNSWKQQGTINTSTSSLKSPSSNPSSPSLPPVKRRKCVPNKVIVKDNLECSDTNSNQGCSEAESDVVIVKREKSDSENRDPEEDCNSLDEISREESSREENPSVYEMMESDETEEENGEIGNKAAISNNDNSGNLNASSSSLFNIVPTYSSQSSTEPQNSSAPGDTRLGRRPCPLCQKIISNKSNLLKHMRIRHSDEHNPAGCTICNKVFKNKYSLRAHINIYHKEMNTGAGNVSLSASYSPQLSSSEYNTHHQQQPTSNSHPDYLVSSQRSVSLSYSATSSSGYNLVSSSINNDLSSYEMVKENILNQFNISNLPLT